MTAFYDELAEVADELLSEFGQACVLGVVTTGDYDSDSATAPTDPAEYPVTAALFDYPQKFIDGTLIKVGDKRALVSAVGLTVEPAPGNTLTDAAGAVFTVINAKATAPAGTAVLWTLQVRK